MIELLYDDMLKQDVDVIVNAANTHMRHMGGLARIIANAGGDVVEQESRAQRPVPTGQAILTSAGNLPQKGIVHAVGPIWNGGDDLEDQLLANAYRNSIRVAAENGYHSIAFPAISCGIFRYPVVQAAPVAVKAIREALVDYPQIDKVLICVMDDHHYEAFNLALSE